MGVEQTAPRRSQPMARGGVGGCPGVQGELLRAGGGDGGRPGRLGNELALPSNRRDPGICSGRCQPYPEAVAPSPARDEEGSPGPRTLALSACWADRKRHPERKPSRGTRGLLGIISVLPLVSLLLGRSPVDPAVLGLLRVSGSAPLTSSHHPTCGSQGRESSEVLSSQTGAPFSPLRKWTA